MFLKRKTRLAIFYFFRLDLSYILFGVVKPSYVIIMGVIVFFDTIWSIPMLAFRAENRPRLFISLSLLNVGITLLCNLLFIIILKMSIGSIFLSNLIASSFLFILVMGVCLSNPIFVLLHSNAKILLLLYSLKFLVLELVPPTSNFFHPVPKMDMV